MANYPGALPALNTAKADGTATAGDHAANHNAANDEVNAMGAELGTNAKGLYAANIRERFEISSYKNQSVKAASTVNIAGTYANGTAGVGATKAVGGTTLTVDGQAMANADRVLLKDQTSAFENGIYTVSGIGTSVVLTRAIDADTSAKIADCRVLVDQGTFAGDTEWGCTATNPTMGTTVLPFKRTLPIYGHGNPRYPWDVAYQTTPVIAATIPRAMATATLAIAAASNAVYMVGGIVLPAGRLVTTINLIHASGTAPGAITVDWMAIARQSDGLVLGTTTNNTTLWTANVTRSRAVATPFTPSYDTPVYVLLAFNMATTGPTILAGPAYSSGSTNMGKAPALLALSGTNSTATPPTAGTTTHTPAAGGHTGGMPYLWLT